MTAPVVAEIVFRGDLEAEARRVFEFRELLRGRKHEQMPNGSSGLVLEDLDLVVRWYGPRYGLDGWGRFRYVEVKRRGFSVGVAQRFTFGMAHSILSERPDRYDGYYVVTHSNDGHDETTDYTVNGQAMTCTEFCAWIRNPYSTVASWRRSTIPLLEVP